MVKVTLEYNDLAITYGFEPIADDKENVEALGFALDRRIVNLPRFYKDGEEKEPVLDESGKPVGLLQYINFGVKRGN